MKKSQLYERPPNSPNAFGEGEKHWHHCGAGSTVVNLLRKKVIPKGTTIRIITNNYREDKWGFKSDWYKFAKEKLDEGIKIKAYGGPGIEARDAVGELVKSKMSLFEINGHLRKEGVQEHYVTVDNPAQIWAEAEHMGFYAYGCIYTDKPYKDAWAGVDNYFKDIEKEGRWLKYEDVMKEHREAR
jgi:hypothetical protein